MTGARADRCRLQAGSPATGILVLGCSVPCTPEQQA